MEIPELIALLTARSTLFTNDDRQRSNNGLVLTRSELAGYLSGLSQGAMYVALAKYGDDEDSLRHLIAWVRVMAAKLANEQDWEVVRGKPVIANLSAIAAFEVVVPMVHDVCHGRGFNAGKPCTCSGTGIKPLSDRRIQEATGIERMNWRRVWQGRYRQILRAVIELDTEVQSGFGMIRKTA